MEDEGRLETDAELGKGDWGFANESDDADGCDGGRADAASED